MSSWLKAPCKKFKLSRAGPKDMFDNMTPRHQIAWCRWMVYAIIRKFYSAANRKCHRNLQLVQMQQTSDHRVPSPSLHNPYIWGSGDIMKSIGILQKPEKQKACCEIVSSTHGRKSWNLNIMVMQRMTKTVGIAIWIEEIPQSPLPRRRAREIK